MIVGLLAKDPSKRLGVENGVQDIMDHPWFSNLDWEEIRAKTYKPPYTPDLENFGLYNFDESFVNQKVDDKDYDDFQTLNNPTYSDFFTGIFYL